MSVVSKKAFSLSEEGRAWVEIDLDALAHNAREICAILPDGCDLMAVLKADAYGHGALCVAERLWKEGVRSFAVATVGEAALLREGGLGGEIFVLNYSHPRNAVYIHDFDLTQVVADEAHAKALDEAGYEIRVHIAVDTGMHREGVDFSDFRGIESIFKMKNLCVTGMSSHLASQDDRSFDEINFTHLQIERFYNTVDSMKNMGYDVGKLHFQASYGMLNFPAVRCDYVRAGLALYGAMSSREVLVTNPDLRPVLSLRSVIAQVRQIAAGESVSYGRTYTADKPIKLATVCIGYADGVPRHMSGNAGECIIHGKRAPIVGRICMDLLMVDVSAIDFVAPGDIATLIGSDGGEEIRCEEFALKSGSITNDILSRLGGRLPRIYIESGRSPR